MSNQYVQELLRRAENRYAIDSDDMPMGEWLCRNTNLRGRPFSFTRYPFQRRIADDMHPNMDVIKPSQVGLSEVQIRKSLGFVARNRETTGIFTMPNEKMFKRMSTTRIKPLVEDEKVFNLDTRSGEKPTRSMGLYQVGSSFLFVTGATEGDATSISADFVMNDEIDLTDQSMLALFNSRLQNSDFKINQRFSTPTFVNFGVDKGFQVSDQHSFLCKCDACNHWNDPIFRPNFVEIPGLPSDLNDLTDINEEMIDAGQLDLVNSYVKCERCGSPLDLGREESREWVAKFPSRSHHRGYRVSPFSTDRLSVEYIITQFLKYRSRDYLRGWYNTVLGEAYTDGNSQLSDADINACFTGRMGVPEIDASAPTWIGIDVGQTCHIVVGQGNDADSMHIIRFLAVPVKDLKSTVKDFSETYNIIGGACDRFPYTPTAEEVRDETETKVVPVEYRGQKEVKLVMDEIEENLVLYAQMNRTALLDKVAAVVRRKKIAFSGYGGDQSVIRDHLKDMVRDENPEVEAKWVKISGNDHYFHAIGFLLAAVRLKETQIHLFTDPRTTVAVLGVPSSPATTGGLLNQNSKKQVKSDSLL